MMKTRLLFALLLVSILLIGCTKNVYYTAPPEQQSNQQDTKMNLLSQTQERELVNKWMNMYQKYAPKLLDERFLNEAVSLFESQGLHPIKIYKGSMIFYEESYGYLYIPEVDNDFRTLAMSDWRQLPNAKDEMIRYLIQKYDGTEAVLPHGEWVANFQNLNDIESFLTEFWVI